jgi:membrane protease YdiL (CAAX protease family)
MASGSKSFNASMQTEIPASVAITAGRRRDRVADWVKLIEVGLIFGLILVAVWTPQGRFNVNVCWTAAVATVVLSLRGHYSARELGLSRPASGAVITIAAGALLAGLIAAIGVLSRSLGPSQPLPWMRAWQYGLWSLLQQFILQSFIYVRLESLFGALRALLGTSFLFAVAHLPSPVLTVLAFVGALFFCEMFRRYRNIYPLGLVHAALGLSIAASLPDSLLHHMRVGLGYLMYHP